VSHHPRIASVPLAATTLLVPLVVASTGCLSLSMLNREAPDTKTRLDSLESRVTALEVATGHRSGPVVTPPINGAAAMPARPAPGPVQMPASP
jgi:hypothetical protein